MVNRSPKLALKKSCTVYDVLETDVSKKVIAVFDSTFECSKFLGISPQLVNRMIATKYRNKKNKLNKLICIR